MPASKASKADRLSVFPVFHKVEGRVAVVVGDGEEALAKARLLSESLVRVRLIAPAPSRELGVFIIQSDADHVAAPFSPAMLEGAALVFAATGDTTRDEAIVDAAHTRNIPVNAVDRPELCDFYVPALVNRAPVAIAIGSEGSGPVLTQILRSKIEALLPRSTGPLARLAARYRQTVSRVVPRGSARRRFWRAFFDGPVARCAEAGDMAGARRATMQLLKRPADAAGFVSIVGAGPGDEDLLTLRAQRALLEADAILHAPETSRRIVALGRRDAHRVSVDPAEAAQRLIAEAGAGNRVVLLIDGDPRADAASEALVATLDEAGIAFEIVPGIAASSQAALGKTAAGQTADHRKSQSRSVAA